jgi:hypothetical protein
LHHEDSPGVFRPCHLNDAFGSQALYVLAISTVNRDTITAGYKPDYLIAWDWCAAARHLGHYIR